MEKLPRIVAELLGVEQLRQLVTNLWDHAPTDVKSELSRHVLELAVKGKDHKFVVAQAVQEKIREVADEHIAQYKEAILERVTECFNCQFESYVERAVQASLADTLKRVTAEIKFKNGNAW